jgi:acetyltransferase-like isoleucine patch superfamily enzyme
LTSNPPGGRLRAALREPGAAFTAVIALARGRLFGLRCRLRGIRFAGGRNLRVYGRCALRGSGSIVIGNDVVLSHNLRHVYLGVLGSDAEIRIGDRVWLNGTSISCHGRVEIGDRALVGRTDLVDHEFHDPRDFERKRAIRVAPITIGADAWVGNDGLILKGVAIGRHSVVGARTVVRRSLPDRVVAIGNPAQIVKQL